jgi:hypothetical protein
MREDDDVARTERDVFAGAVQACPAPPRLHHVEASTVSGLPPEVQRPRCSELGPGRQCAAQVNGLEDLRQHVKAGIETFEHGLERITHSYARQEAVRYPPGSTMPIDDRERGAHRDGWLQTVLVIAGVSREGVHVRPVVRTG